MVSKKQTPIEKAAEEVANYFEELPKPRDIDEVAAIIRKHISIELEGLYSKIEDLEDEIRHLYETAAGADI